MNFTQVSILFVEVVDPLTLTFAVNRGHKYGIATLLASQNTVNLFRVLQTVKDS